MKEYKQGDIFGASEIISGQHRIADAVAKTETTLITINNEFFHELFFQKDRMALA